MLNHAEPSLTIIHNLRIPSELIYSLGGCISSPIHTPDQSSYFILVFLVIFHRKAPFNTRFFGWGWIIRFSSPRRFMHLVKLHGHTWWVTILDGWYRINAPPFCQWVMKLRTSPSCISGRLNQDQSRSSRANTNCWPMVFNYGWRWPLAITMINRTIIPKWWAHFQCQGSDYQRVAH